VYAIVTLSPGWMFVSLDLAWITYSRPMCLTIRAFRFDVILAESLPSS
jgi:hypothetical protein